MEENEKDEKDIEIVDGSGDLEISPVYTHLNINNKPEDDNKKKNIVIPEEKK